MTLLRNRPGNKEPLTIIEAAEYVNKGEPTDVEELVNWMNIRDQLYDKCKDEALIRLRDLLQTISSESLIQTEGAIDDALSKLKKLAPVNWELDRSKGEDLAGGSRKYQLKGLDAMINPNGAFSIIDRNRATWLTRASANGVAFVSPEDVGSEAGSTDTRMKRFLKCFARKT
jgi:hypothetical protein